jgi:hypothetical protein
MLETIKETFLPSKERHHLPCEYRVPNLGRARGREQAPGEACAPI